MAGRSQFYQSIGYRDTLADNAYRVLLSGRVTVYIAPPFAAQSMTTLASIFSASTGVGSPGNPFDATAGEASFFAGPGAYDVKIEDMAVPARFATRTIRFEAQPGDQGIIAQMIAAGAIGATAIADGAINNNKIASNAAISESKLALTPGQLWMPGDVKQTTRSAAPAGWIQAIGLTLSRSAYPALWSVAQAEVSAGNQIYGAGDGSTNFTVADLSRRVLIGAGSAGGLSTRALGAGGGAETHTLTEAQLASHMHTLGTDQGNNNAIYRDSGGGPNSNSIGYAGAQGGVMRAQPAGGGQAHNNMQPFVTVHTLIKT
jgi:microcystin-dependent protein